MFNYSFTAKDGQITINTPKVENFSDIKREVKEELTCAINHSIYPDGLDITMTQFADKIILTSNRELIKHSNGTYSFKD